MHHLGIAVKNEVMLLLPVAAAKDDLLVFGFLADLPYKVLLKYL